jgi:sterol desaturase/sphingolipid hydroxylase (fatty acid hydroxylase superfamily)
MEDQNQFQNPNQFQSTPSVTTGDWFVTMLITAIPLVGLIMLFVWAFGGGTNLNKSNWAKAALIWAVIVTVLYIIIFATFGFAMFRGFYGTHA